MAALALGFSLLSRLRTPTLSVSQTAEYALRAVVWLAHKPGECQTTTQLADGTLVSPSYLPKVLQPLGRAGILSSQRGIRGGYALRRDPE